MIRLIRTETIRPEHFTMTLDKGCRLDDVGRRAFLAAYERRLLTLVHHPAEGRRISWRQAMIVQARRIAAVLEGREHDYQAVTWR